MAEDNEGERALWEIVSQGKAHSVPPRNPLVASSYPNRSYREALVSSQLLVGLRGGGHRNRTKQKHL